MTDKAIKSQKKQRKQGLDAEVFANPGQNLNPDGYYKGKFTKKLPHAEEFDIRRQVGTDARLQTLGPLAPLDPQRLLELQKSAEAQEIDILGHRIAKWSVDKEKRSDVLKLKQVDPELWEKMDEPIRQEATFSLLLRQLLRQGELQSKEDLEFTVGLLDKDVRIPVYPLWDMDGNIFGPTLHKSFAPKYATRLWDAFSKASIKTVPFGAMKNGNTSKQRSIKSHILFHLLPAMRNIKGTTGTYANLQTMLAADDSQLSTAQISLRNFYLAAPLLGDGGTDPSDTGIFAKGGDGNRRAALAAFYANKFTQ